MSAPSKACGRQSVKIRQGQNITSRPLPTVAKFYFACLTAALSLAVSADDFVPEGKDGAAIQVAIDKAAAAGGGRVVVAPGIYPTRTLRMKSRVELHLTKGAVVQGSTNGYHYLAFPKEIAKMSRSLVQAWHAEDFAITGEGDFDCNGWAFFDTNKIWRGINPNFYEPRPMRPLMVCFYKCRNVRFEGVGFLNSSSWTMRLRLCENLDFNRVRVINNLKFINADGIDFDGCRHVRVTDSDFVTGDDSIVLRAIRVEGSSEKVVTEDVLVENCRLESACQCIRIGCPSDDTIRDVRIRNITAKGLNGIVFGNPPVYLSASNEGYVNVHNVSIENFTGAFSNYAFWVNVGSGIKLRGIRDIFLANCTVTSPRPLTFQGNIYSPVERIYCKNVTHNGTNVVDGAFATVCTDDKPLRRQRPGEYNYKQPKPYVAPRYLTVGSLTAEAIQKAIDDVAANPSGGRVTVKTGVYENATLTLRSRVELRLESGAIVRGDGTNALLSVTDSRDVSITGNGTLTGGAVNMTRCGAVQIDGILLTAPMTLAECNDVQVDGVRATKPVTFTDCCGVRVANCQGVTAPQDAAGLSALASTGVLKAGATPRNVVVSERNGAAIQKAIDDVAATGGGRVTLTQGVWPSGTLYLKSRVELHLEKGAILQGGAKPEDYDDVETREGIYPEKSKKVFIVAEEAEDVAITGEGTVDGCGPAFYDTNVPDGQFFKKPPHPRPRMVQFMRCRRVRFEGVTFKDSPGWTAWLRFCEDVCVTGIRIIGHQQMINNDGIDFDGCRFVRVRDSEFKTGDDCLVLRAMRGKEDTGNEPVICEDIVVENCRLDSACQCVRVGCPSDDTIRRAVFRNIVARGRNGILSLQPYRYLRPGDHGYLKTRDLVFENWDVECRGAPVTLKVEKGIALRDFGHFTFRNFQVRSVLPFEIVGCYESVISDIVFENVSGKVDAANPMLMESVSGIDLRGFNVSSGPGKPNPFKGSQGDSWETHAPDKNKAPQPPVGQNSESSKSRKML